jgi:hypothetical protein
MNQADQTELITLLKDDDEKTAKLIEGIVGSTFTIRGWGVALVSALIGLTFQTHLWTVAALAIVATLLIGFIDGYHSWLYGVLLVHAQAVERVLTAYYSSLSRGEDDPQAREDFQVALIAHQFGRFNGVRKFRVRDLKRARPRIVILILYGALLASAASSGLIVHFSAKTPSEEKVECTPVSGSPRAFLCVKK